MSIQDVLHNGQPQARAAPVFRAAFFNTVKTLKNTAQVFGRNAGAIVADGYNDMFFIVFQVDLHTPIFIAVFDRVFNQVRHHLRNTLRIGFHPNRAGCASFLTEATSVSHEQFFPAAQKFPA